MMQIKENFKKEKCNKLNKKQEIENKDKKKKNNKWKETLEIK